MPVVNSSTQLNHHRSLQSTYYKYEQEKRRHYDHQMCEVEHAFITMLVMSTTGGMGCAATMFSKRPASMMAEKRDIFNAVTMNWMYTCGLSFASLRAFIISIRGAHSSRYYPATECPIDLQLGEGHYSLTSNILCILLPCITFVTDVTPNVGTL